jgi:uncharacterized protein (DUF1800 family)
MDGQTRSRESLSRRAFLGGSSSEQAIVASVGQGPSPLSLGTGLITPSYAAYVLNRIGYGPRKGTPFSIESFNALGANDSARLTAFVDQQLSPSLDGNGNVHDADVATRLAHTDYLTLNKSFEQLWNDHEVNGSPTGGTYTRDWPIREVERATFVRAFHSRWGLFEQMSDFWHNHFSCYGFDRYAGPTWVSWDRDVIRKNALGNFRTMLQKTFEAPAMLYFLDNYINRAPSFNENYAREIIELHTLGAMNYLGPNLQQNEVPTIPAGQPGAGWPVGYVDADVYELARSFTGWTFYRSGETNTGQAYLITAQHDIGQKTVLGEFAAANTPYATEHAKFLDRLAYHPGTARHIATKLARRFIGENAPQAVIDNAAEVFWQNRTANDQIKKTVRAILLHDAGAGSFRDIGNFGNKLKKPFEVVVSALRAVNVEFTVRRNDSESNSFMDRFARTGHRPFDWRAPNGFPDKSDYWMGSGQFVHAWRTIDWTLDENTGSGQGDPLVPLLAITTTEFSNQPAQHTPNKLANFWLSRIFGWSPHATNGWIGTELHTRIRDFMCRNSDTVSYFGADVGIGAGPAGNTAGIASDSNPNYWYSRLRGMVGCIVFSPQFMVR